MIEMAATEEPGAPAARYGRTQEQWDAMAEAVEEFLIEVARSEKQTDYTAVNGRITEEGLPAFNFYKDAERAALSALLDTVSVRSHQRHGILLTVLVIHHDTPNDIGGGFWKMAARLGKVPPKLSTAGRLDALVDLTKEVFGRYAG